MLAPLANQRENIIEQVSQCSQQWETDHGDYKWLRPGPVQLQDAAPGPDLPHPQHRDARRGDPGQSQDPALPQQRGHPHVLQEHPVQLQCLLLIGQGGNIILKKVCIYNFLL